MSLASGALGAVIFSGAAAAAAPAPSYSAEAEALFLRMSGSPDATRKGHIDTLIGSLKAGALSSSNIWAKLDIFSVYAALNSADGLVNWKPTPAYDGVLTSGGGVVFTADRGFKGDGTGYVDHAMIANVAGANWSQDSAVMGAYVNVDGGGVLATTGFGTSTATRVFPLSAASTMLARVNSATNSTYAVVNNRLGSASASRTGASAGAAYRDGVSVGTFVTASSTPAIGAPAQAFRSSSGVCSDRIAAVWFGGGLTANEHADLYNAIQTYLVAVGGQA